MPQRSEGLTRAKEIYKDPACRARELKAEGKKVIGYLCIYPPVEIMTALDLLPYRVFGDMREPITKADTCLPTVVCPFIRSCLDLGVKGKYDFLDGIVFSHVCDVAEKTAHIWHVYLKPAYFHFIDTPHTIHKAAQKQLKEQLKYFQKTLESLTGKGLSQGRLKEVIQIYNQQRALVRELYEMKKADPPLISGAETLQVMKALMVIPVEEGNELLRQVIREVKERKDGPQRKPVRLLVWGSIIDDIALIDMIEDAGANVVIDDTCVGSRAYFPDVELTDDPLDGLAYRYLVELKCPRTFREAVFGEIKKDYMVDLESRFGYLKDYAKEWNANGVIIQSVRYCDTHGYEVPGLKDYFDHVGLPNTYLEHDYTEAALAPLRTRVQAFLEVIR
jgi:bzd-type benzoyl-CoA reductase N subunit